MNNFDLLAPVYDRIARLIFRKNLHHATIHFLREIPVNSKVLVLGGGTGEMLHSLNNCQTVYVEKSLKMIRLASTRAERGEVDFICEDFFRWKEGQLFDVVVCPFFLDVFSADNLERAILKIEGHMKSGAKLLVTDFQKTDRWFHRLIIYIMHVFFGVFSRLESRDLKPIKKSLINRGFQILDEKRWMSGLVFAAKFSRVEAQS